MNSNQTKKIKLDKGINLSLYQTIYNWRQLNGLKHEDYTRYRRFCTRRLKRIREKVNLQQKWEKKQFKQIKLKPEQIKTNEHLMIPLLLIERCWSYSNELEPIDETEMIKKHHQKRRIHKMKIFCEQFEFLMKNANKRSQREILSYCCYMKGMIYFEDKKYEESMKEYMKSKKIIEFITEEMSEENKIIFKDINDDIQSKIRVIQEEIENNKINEKEKEVEEEIMKWKNIDGEAQMYLIPDEYMRDKMKIYREGKKKSLKERREIIQECVIHCNKMMQNKKLTNRMLYKELLDYVRNEKYKLSVEELINEIVECEKHLGEFSLNNEVIDNSGKYEIVVQWYNKLISMEKKKLGNDDSVQLQCWLLYKMYYQCLILLNNNKSKECYTELINLLDKINEISELIDSNEKERMDMMENCIHKVNVKILNALWIEKSGEKPIMMDACSQYLNYPTFEAKAGWFSWIWGSK